jgi:hypothetical protein
VAFIEIGMWYHAKEPLKAEHLAVVLVHPYPERWGDGTYYVGWQPTIPDMFPAPF